ncbi:alanyl-tRNA editing protein [Kistimonas asteriae]|uniref:alanyl-tRNA editing protein n=1 Tax=Kistimonas asteriae TaxID=517724 RepID=UPI001BA49C0F|nr:alanyl-tRNA editing protein [Kistimonas asteriae]
MNHSAPVFYQDPYQKVLTTTVSSIQDQNVVLAETIFYPNGGGQPGDTGHINASNGNQFTITNTRKDHESGTIVHEISEAPLDLQPGDTVTVTLDWSRRYAHMRMHTCMHLLCSLIPCGVTGGALTADKGRLDFDMGDFDANKELLTQQLNALIGQAEPISIECLEASVLDTNPELVRTMSVQPPRGAGKIRMVRTGTTDYQPCGGTHVANTREIGLVRISKIENKGQRNKRVVIVFSNGEKQ